MQTLQKYTREYLFDKFRAEYHQQRPSSRHSAPHHGPQGMSHLASLPHNSRPILAIDTAPHQALPRHPGLGGHRDIHGDMHSAPITRSLPDSMGSSASARGSSSSEAVILYSNLPSSWLLGSVKQRTKKITVACNFCRCKH